MSGINKVILVGHLGKDPEVRHLEGGNVVANFTLATSEPFKDKTGNRIDHTEWHNIVLWGKSAEIAEKYLKKGSHIYLEGKIRSRTWDDKEGNKRYITEVRGERFTMLDKKGDSSDGANQPVASVAAENGGEEVADDLPF